MLNTENNELLKVILGRKSVRVFTGEKMDKETVNLLIRAGMAAPSSMNKQPWSFIGITDRAILNELGDGLPYAKMLKQAGAAIVVCGSPDFENAELRDYWVQDCSAATENILLAVEAIGLGAVWTGVFPRKDRLDYVRKTLKIPPEYLPLNVLAIGQPATLTQPKDKYISEKIHWDCW